MSKIVFDLTEVFSASAGKLRYYGIVRVVAEIGQELRRRNADVRYGIYSYAHDGLLEVIPDLDPDGTVHLNVPLGLREIRTRPAYRRKSWFVRGLTVLINPLLRMHNRRVWRKAGVTRPPLDMTGKTLVSAARPKLITDAMVSLERQGVPFDLVPILHDMIPLHPEFGHKSAYFPGKFLDDNCQVIARASRILSVSEFTRDEILRFVEKGVLPSPPSIDPIQLVHECPDGTDPVTLETPPKPYVLTVGATMGRKNLDASFEALLALHAQGKPVPTLILAGAVRRTTRKYLETERMAPVRDKVLFYPNPGQADLVFLYRNALAVVMASRMEGWGLPAGEALWCGTPVICSTAPALREVCGDLALYFDPDAPDQLAAHLRQLMEDPDGYAALKARIAQARPHLRDWRHVTTDLQNVMETL